MSPHSTTDNVFNDIRHIGLSYNNAESESSALNLVFALYPSWQHEKGKVEFVRFTEGITNTVRKWFSPRSAGPSVTETPTIAAQGREETTGIHRSTDR